MVKKSILNKLPREILSMVHNMARFDKTLRDKGVNDLKAFLDRDGPIPASGKY